MNGSMADDMNEESRVWWVRLIDALRCVMSVRCVHGQGVLIGGGLSSQHGWVGALGTAPWAYQKSPLTCWPTVISFLEPQHTYSMSP